MILLRKTRIQSFWTWKALTANQNLNRPQLYLEYLMAMAARRYVSENFITSTLKHIARTEYAVHVPGWFRHTLVQIEHEVWMQGSP